MKLGKIATSFSRGLSQAATHTLDQLECQTSENFVFKDRSATVRGGIKIYSTLSTPAPIVSLEKFYKANGDTYFCAIANGQIQYSNVSGAFTSISSENISGEVRKTVFDGALYITDFSSAIKYFNGGSVGIAGLSSPQFRYQLSDMEDVTKWNNNGNGVAQEDLSYLHRDKGDKAISFSASSPAAAAVFQYAAIDNSLESNIKPTSDSDYLNYTKTRIVTRTATSNIALIDISGNLYQSYNNGSTFNTSSVLALISGYSTFSWIGVQEKFYPIHSNLSSEYIVIGKTSSTVNVLKCASGGNWSTISQTYISGYNPRSIDLDIDSSGNINILCAAAAPNTEARYEAIKILYNGSTQTSNMYSTGNQNYYLGSLRCDRSGFVHYLTTDSSSKIDLVYLTNKSSAYRTYITSGETDAGVTGVFGDMAIDTSSNVHAVYSVVYGTGTPHYAVFYKKKYNGSSYWGDAVILTSTPDTIAQAYPSISIESNNRVHIFWAGLTNDSPSQYQLRYTTSLSSIADVLSIDNIGGTPSYVFPIDTMCQVNGIRHARTSSGYAIVYTKNESKFFVNAAYNAATNIKWAYDAVDPLSFNLNYFGTTAVSSQGIDIIQLFTVPNKKAQISSFVLRFVDSNTYYASKEIVNTSAWKSVSNDEWGMTIGVSKSSFTLTNAAFNWGSCNMEVTLTPVSGTNYLAKVAVDNIRMLKSPPVIAYSVSTTANTNQLFFGSSSTEKKVVPFTLPPFRGLLGGGPSDQPVVDVRLISAQPIPPSAVDLLQLEGKKQIEDPLPSGTYYYKCTFVKPSPSGYETESNPSGQSSGWIVSNNMSSWTYLGLTNVPIAPDSFGVSGRRIYRRRSKEEVMRHVYTIHDNRTTTFFDTVPDQTLGWVLEEDNFPPPNAKFMKNGPDQRMYYYNVAEFGEVYPSRIRISKPYEPYYVPIDLTFDISPDDGTEGTGLFNFNGAMYFLKERSTWILQNQPISVSDSIGCIAPDSVAVGRNEVFWLSENGPIKFNGRFYNLSHSVDEKSLYRIQTILDRLPKDYIKNARGVYYNGYYLLSVTDAGSTVNNLVLCYDTDNDVWTTFPNINVNCWATWNGYKDGYRLFFGNYSGQICEFFTGNYDVSTPISWSIRSKEFGTTSPEEFVRKAYTFMENLDGQNKEITVQPYYDFTQTSSNATTHIMSGNATYFTFRTDFPGGDSASFYGMGISGSGRVKINVAEIYTKKENLR